MENKLYKLGIHGCDDSTYLDLNLNQKEAELIKKICAKSVEVSTYGCMPTMEINIKKV